MKRVPVLICSVMLAFSVMPVNSAYAAEASDWASLEGWLAATNGFLADIYADTTNIYRQLSDYTYQWTQNGYIRHSLYYYVNNTYSKLSDVASDIAGIDARLSTIGSNIATVSTQTSNIYNNISNVVTNQNTVISKLTTTNNKLESIYQEVNSWHSTWLDVKTAILPWLENTSDKASNMATNLVAINNNLITGFQDMYLAINGLHTDLSNIYSLLNTKFISKYVNANGNDVWYLRVYPIDLDPSSHAHFVRSIEDGLTSIKSKLDTLHDDITSVNTTLTNLYNILNRNYLAKYDNVNGNPVWYLRVYPIDLDPNTHAHFVRSIEDGLTNINTKLGNIYTAITSIQIPDYLNTLNSLNTTLTNLYNVLSRNYLSSYVNDNGNPVWYLRVYPIDLNTGSHAHFVQAVENGLTNIVNAINGLNIPDLSGITSQLRLIVGLLSVPSDVTSLVGDFNDLNFLDDVDDLTEEISNLAPFGSVALISGLISVLVSTNTPAVPKFEMPFDFFGQNIVSIDLSWLMDARPLINFLMIFLLVYSLAVISIKWVRQEASS